MLLTSPILVAIAAALTFPSTVTSEKELCGNKYCGIGAECNSDQKCECPLNAPLGDPVFRCHEDTTVSCVVIGDPSLLGFSGAQTFMDFPCKYTLAKYDTQLLTRKQNKLAPNSWSVTDPGIDKCRVIVSATNAMTPKGSYYVKNVEVAIVFNIGGSSKLEALIVKINENNSTYSYAPNPEITVEKGDENDCFPKDVDPVNSIGVSLCFTPDNNMWSVSVPVCGGTSVNFRAWEGESENQPRRPGVAVTTIGDSAIFTSDELAYPGTMCDRPFHDTDDVYHETCKSIGVRGKRNCALYAFLTNNPPQQPHYCVASVKFFSLCQGDQKTRAINNCGRIVTELAKCVIKNDKNVMHVFEACVAAVCFNPTTCTSIAEYIHHGDEEDCNSFAHPC